ncbi:MAG: SAM-dependent methyltransferase [Dehalococcoidia bacterium]|nr:SAM-dependent methyltransferase [Dehalococcoidia bacterium]
MRAAGRLPSSFRDPAGFVFIQEGQLYRQIDHSYAQHYDHLIRSGLFEKLVTQQRLIPHEEVDLALALTDSAYKVISPHALPFISYPYEWCFTQLKQAALTTLEIQKQALACGMSLKDCSAYNIQFSNSRPVFIDTLSFEIHREGQPWVAYRQFCEQFLAPLALMAYRDIRLSRLSQLYLDGVPLDLASVLLPRRTWLRLHLLTHIHLHARSQKRYSDRTVDRRAGRMSQRSILGLIDNLYSGISGLNWQPRGTEWSDYYECTNYSTQALAQKKQIVTQYLDQIKPTSVWDLGANIGAFSRIASGAGMHTVAFDVDPAAVEKHYLDCAAREDANTLPLVLDLTNPSPATGWAHEERMAWLERGCPDAVLALALIHHLAIGHNLPIPKIADLLHKLGGDLVIEFVPKQDSQVQRLLANRDDVFPEYTQQHFEAAFSTCYAISERIEIADTERTLYLMRHKNNPS